MRYLVYALEQKQADMMTVVGQLRAERHVAHGRNASYWHGEVERCDAMLWLAGCEAVAAAYEAAGVQTSQAVLDGADPATRPERGDAAPAPTSLAGGESPAGRADEAPADEASRVSRTAPPAPPAYEGMTFRALRAAAREAGISAYQKSADELRAALRARG